MYYLIKKQLNNLPSAFVGFQVPKYIARKNSDTIIFEFTKDGKPHRKWVKKEEIIYLHKIENFL